MEALGDKLGPLLFQFGKFDKYAFKSREDFLARLIPFLKKLPKERKFAVEIRNRDWLVPKFADVVRVHGVALTLIDQGWMPRPWEMKDKFELVTSDFTYVRWLGNRKGIEEKTTTWDKVIVDRREDLTNWVEVFRHFVSRNLKVFAYANNHYAGNLSWPMTPSGMRTAPKVVVQEEPGKQKPRSCRAQEFGPSSAHGNARRKK